MKELHKKGFPNREQCVNHMSINDNSRNNEETRPDWQHSKLSVKYFWTFNRKSLNSNKGMQNLSISCALVCLIILGSAALVGTFGICQRQVSAVLVTGVMYLLAGNFKSFSKMYYIFKKIFLQHFSLFLHSW